MSRTIIVSQVYCLPEEVQNSRLPRFLRPLRGWLVNLGNYSKAKSLLAHPEFCISCRYGKYEVILRVHIRMGHTRVGLGGRPNVWTYGSNTVRHPCVWVYGRMRARPKQLDLSHAWVILAAAQAHGTSKRMGHTQTHTDVPSVDGMSFISVRPVRVKRSIFKAYRNVVLWYGTSHTPLCHTRPLVVWPTLLNPMGTHQIIVADIDIHKCWRG